MRVTSQKGFSGIDERITLQKGLSVAEDMLNFRINDAGSLCKRPNTEIVYSFANSEIAGIWCGNFKNRDSVFVALKHGLYRVEPDTIPYVPEFIALLPNDDEYNIFEFNGFLYVKSQNFYGKYDGETFTEVEGYIPCVAINCSPSGEGEVFEQINLICDKRRQLFSGDGNIFQYFLAEKDVEELISVKFEDETFETLYHLKNGDQIIFKDPPPEGINNVEVIYRKSNAKSDKDRIMKCTKLMTFGGNSDGRAFLWGNPDFPNYRFHSELADGVPSVEYFPVNAFTVIGNSKINCIVQQYDKQLIFTKNQAYYSYCELREDGLGNIYSSFPVFSLNGSKGCIIEMNSCIIDNRPVTLCEDGLNLWEATALENEKNAICFSNPIKERLSSMLEKDKDGIGFLDFQANRELLIIGSDNTYIYNYGNGSFYAYTYLSGKHHAVHGSKIYYARGFDLYVFSNSMTTKYHNRCFFKSAYITAGQNEGVFDVTELTADVFVDGATTIKFSLEKSGGDVVVERQFQFKESDCKYQRISFRPAIKRAMPFRVSIEATGKGNIVIHGISIKTRKKERSKRIELL